MLRSGVGETFGPSEARSPLQAIAMKSELMAMIQRRFVVWLMSVVIVRRLEMLRGRQFQELAAAAGFNLPDVLAAMRRRLARSAMLAMPIAVSATVDGSGTVANG